MRPTNAQVPLMRADNQTAFSLIPNNTACADWGNLASGPVTVSLLFRKPMPEILLEADLRLQVKPFTSNGDAGQLTSSRSPFTDSAGMVGYSITGSSGTLYLRMLGSNPYMSVRSNWAYVQILTSDDPIDQVHYNALYNAETMSASHSFEGKTLSVCMTPNPCQY